MGRKKSKAGKAKTVQQQQNGEDEAMKAATVEPNTPLAKLLRNEDDVLFRDFVEILGTETEAVNINERDEKGMTALCFAAMLEKTERIRILLENKADPNLPDTQFGATPLFYATGRYPNTEIAELLIEYGANVNYKSRRGATALHEACLSGNLDCIKLLMKHGADPRDTDDEGTTALDLAKDNETREILHKKNRREDEKLDKVDEACKVCGKTEDEPGIKLKRCSVCHAVWYCGKECQTKDWKLGHRKSCEGYVVGYIGETPGGPFATALGNVFGAKQPTVSVHSMRSGEKESAEAKALKNKRFVVKVQVPAGGMKGPMMVYNEDRSVQFGIDSDKPGYFPLVGKIRKEGYMGMKGYFWAQRTGQEDGGVKVFHSKMAPFQHRW